jgi:hypothetical protein
MKGGLLQRLRKTTAPSIKTAGNTVETQSIHIICSVQGLLYPEDASTAILKSVGKCVPVGTALHPTKLQCSS